MVRWQKSFGGREKYWPCDLKKDRINDCVIRAIAHGTGMDYKVAYDEIFAMAMSEGNMPNNPKLWEKYSSRLGGGKQPDEKTGGAARSGLPTTPSKAPTSSERAATLPASRTVCCWTVGTAVTGAVTPTSLPQQRRSRCCERLNRRSQPLSGWSRLLV